MLVNSVGHFILCVVLVFVCVLVYITWCCSVGGRCGLPCGCRVVALGGWVFLILVVC